MTNSTISSDNRTTQFQKEVRREYVRGGPFSAYIGGTQDSIIQTNNNLKKLSIPLIAKLKGAGVKGSAQLTGNEQSLSNFAQIAQPTYKRQGVLVDNEENELAEFDLFSEARPALMNWVQELKRDEIIQAMGAIEAAGTYFNYGGNEGAFGATPASGANMDSWNAANTDRILYGALRANLTSGDHTTSLATIDSTDDKLSADMITLLKRMASNGRPLIRPYLEKSMTPWFVFFVGSFGFRDLKNDATIAAANREARPRAVDQNPIFVDGDLLYDGVIIKEIRDLDNFIDGPVDADDPFAGVWGAGAVGDSLLTGGASSSRVGAGFMCGAQAVTFIMGRNPSFHRRKEDDYEHQNGVGVSLKHDIKKTFYNNKQHGIVTSFHSAAVDA